MSSYHSASSAQSSVVETSEEGFTARMIRLWIEHYERLLGFNIAPL